MEDRSRSSISPRTIFGLCAAATIMLSVALDGVQAAPLYAEPVTAPISVQATPDDGRYQVALGFFERLFKRKKKTPTQQPAKKAAPKKTTPTAPRITTVQKDPDASVIAVFGDEFSQDLAWGLKDAFAQVPDVRVEIRSVPGSGLIYRASRNPLHDIAKALDEKPFSFAVVMVGLNDRVKTPVRKGETGEVILPAYDFKSDAWMRTYSQEVDRLRLAFAKKDRPIYWVGLPPVANKKLSADMLFFNDFFSRRLTERGERFIDIWDAFANDEGEFTYRGPDLTGQDQRLRQKNGIRFNKAGRRKLAFFVEKLVIRALSQSVSEDVLPDNLAKADEEALREGRGANRKIFALRKPPLDSEKLVEPIASFRLSSAAREPQRTRRISRAPEFRADDFSWDGNQ